MKEKFTRSNVHPPVRDGCGTCHLPHASDQSSLLLKVDICQSCHDIEQAGFRQAHAGYGVQKECTACHTPHSSERSGLLKAIVHGPVVNGDCEACHSVNGAGELNRPKDVDSVCINCHAQQDQTAGLHEPFREGDCTDCHAAHASNYVNMLSEKPEKLCLKCHDKGKDKKMRSVHEPVLQGECLACHIGHGSEVDPLLIIGPDRLCFSCHDDSEFTQGPVQHPSSATGQCLTCHAVHESEELKLLKKKHGDAGLCFECHQDLL